VTTDSPATHRVVLLGASNLTISFPLVVRRLRSGLSGRLEVFAALGWGRSYGEWSRVAYRGLPGTIGCGLWRDVAEREPATREAALVTDLGNDLLYGVPVPRIAGWLETCLARLAERRARLVLTLIPLSSLETLSPARFRFMRRLLYPKNRMSFEHLLGESRELNAQLIELGRRYAARVIEPPGEWYGFDPIHIRRSRRARAWETILSGWQALAPPPGFGVPVGWKASRLKRLRPEVRTLFGRQQCTPQPALDLPDGAVWVY
jgi:hypothetical protein